jgi:hypothetical protein
MKKIKFRKELEDFGKKMIGFTKVNYPVCSPMDGAEKY